MCRPLNLKTSTWLGLLWAFLICLAFKTFQPLYQESPSPAMDITLILDNSAQVNSTNYDEIKEAFSILKNAANIELSTSASRLNFIQFDSTFVASGNYLTSNQDAAAQLADSHYLGGVGRDVAGVLQFYNHNRRSNDRPDSRNIIILVLAGASDDKASAIHNAQTLHKLGDAILVVGITRAVDVDEIEQISSAPHRLGENCFLLNDFSQLRTIFPMLTVGLSYHVLPATNNPESSTASVSSNSTIKTSSLTVDEFNLNHNTDTSKSVTTNSTLAVHILAAITAFLAYKQYEVS